MMNRDFYYFFATQRHPYNGTVFWEGKFQHRPEEPCSHNTDQGFKSSSWTLDNLNKLLRNECEITQDKP